MATPQTIGQAGILVRPITNQFEAQLKARLEAANKAINIPIRANVDNAEEAMERLRRRASDPIAGGPVSLDTGQAMASLDSLADQGSQVAQRIQGAMGSAGVAIGAGLTTALYKGYQRFTTIEDSTKAMTVVLGDATKAGKLLDEILQVVTGTPYNLDQFAQAGKNLVAFGAPAEKVPGYLRAIGEAAAASGGSAEAVGSVVNAFGDAVAMGRLTGETLASLAVQGVPALQILANQYGVTTVELRKMVSEGQLPAIEAFDKLSEGIMKGTNGAAGATNAFAGTMATLRTSLSGAVGGMGAAVARFGESIIKGFGPVPIAALNAFSGMLDGLKPRIEAVMSNLSKSEAVEKFLTRFDNLKENMDGIINKVLEFKAAIVPLLAYMGASGAGSLASFLGPFGNILTVISPVTAAIIGLAAATPELREAFTDLGGALINAMEPLLPILAIAANAIGQVTAEILTIGIGPITFLVNSFSSLVGVVEEVANWAGIMFDLIDGSGEGWSSVVTAANAFKVAAVVILNLKIIEWFQGLALAIRGTAVATMNNVKAKNLESNASQTLQQRIAAEAGSNEMLIKVNAKLTASYAALARAKAAAAGSGGIGGGVGTPPPYTGPIPSAPVPGDAAAWLQNYNRAPESISRASRAAGALNGALSKAGGAMASLSAAAGGPLVLGLMAATVAVEGMLWLWKNINEEIKKSEQNSRNAANTRTGWNKIDYKSTDSAFDYLTGTSTKRENFKPQIASADIGRAAFGMKGIDLPGMGFLIDKVGSGIDTKRTNAGLKETQKNLRETARDFTGLGNVIRGLDKDALKRIGVVELTDPKKIREQTELLKSKGVSDASAAALARYSTDDYNKILNETGMTLDELGGDKGKKWREALEAATASTNEEKAATMGLSRELIDLAAQYDAATKAAATFVAGANTVRDNALKSASAQVGPQTILDTFKAEDTDGVMNLNQMQEAATAVSSAIADSAAQAQILAESAAKASGTMTDEEAAAVGLKAAHEAATGAATMWQASLVETLTSMNMTRGEAERIASVISGIAGYKKITVDLDITAALEKLNQLKALQVAMGVFGGVLDDDIGRATADYGRSKLEGAFAIADEARAAFEANQIANAAADQQRADAAKVRSDQAAKEAADAAKRAQAEADRLRKEREAAQKRMDAENKRIFQQAVDNLRSATDDLTNSLRTLSQNVQARGKELAGSITERFVARAGLSTSALIRNANARSGALGEYTQGIATLQQKGFSADALSAIGLTGPESVRQIRRILASSPAEIEQLRASVEGLYSSGQRAAYQEQATIIGKEVYRALFDFWSRTGTPAGNTVEVTAQVGGYSGDPQVLADAIAQRLGGLLGRR